MGALVVTDQVCSTCTSTITVIANLSPASRPLLSPPSKLSMATTTTTNATATAANTRFLPRTAPVVTTIARNTIIARDENEFFDAESSSAHLGRSPSRSALALMWEAIDERDSADNDYASLLKVESQGASGVIFPTFPVSSLFSTIKITSCDELVF